MKIIILDDQIEQIHIIKQLCNEYYSTNEVKVDIQTYSNPDEFLKSNYLDIDLLLLDIEMPNRSGLEIAHKVRSMNKRCFICFITNYSDYMYESYDVHAFDYIMKPIEKERMFKLLNEVTKYQNYRMTNNKKTNLNTSNGELCIDQNKILYFEYHDKFRDLFNRVVILHTIDKKYVLKERIKDIMDKVEPDIFISPHKSFIINMDYIKQISRNEIIMQNNDMIPLSQKRAAHVRKKFTHYIHLFYEEGKE